MRKIDYSGEKKKLSRLFCEEYPLLGYSYFRKVLRNKDVKVNDVRVRDDVEIGKGDTVVFYVKDEQSVFFPTVLFEDKNIVAYYKPKKIASQGTSSFESLIHNNVNSSYVLCHRLDTNTDGILIFAKSEEVFEEIKKTFKNKQIDKYYLAEVYGTIDKAGVYDDYLVKDSDNSRVFVSSTKVAGALEAILEYKPVERRELSTVVEIKLITGRTHQIRAQMAHHGHFVIGDGKYGKEEINRQFKRKTQQLTAYKLCFTTISGKLSYLSGKEITIR